MTLRRAWVAVQAAWLLSVSGAAAGLDLDQQLGAIKSLRGDFVQEVRDSRGALKERAEGRFALARPGRFDWQYHTPAAPRLVSDGTTVWLYDVDLEQVTRRQLGEALGATPLALLAGTGKVSATHRVEPLPTQAGLDWVRLVPLASDAEFTEVLMAFRDQVPAVMQLHDRLGQKTVITLLRVELNARIPENTFQFVPPAGVDVIGLGGA
ncbi:MAG: outer membrane lipoprotein chaperone LolA [Steroidobacteraceae bacterium]